MGWALLVLLTIAALGVYADRKDKKGGPKCPPCSRSLASPSPTMA